MQFRGQLGVVEKVSRYGIVHVVINRSCWNFTPFCLTPAPHRAAEINIDEGI